MKIWKKGLAILLVLVLAVSLCACGKSEEDKLVGTWKCEYDVTDVMNKSFNDSMGAELDIDGTMVLPMTMTMNEDRTFTLEIDSKAYVSSFQTYMDSVVNAIVAYTCDSAAMSKEDLDSLTQEQSGMSAFDYFKDLLVGDQSEEDIVKQLEEASSTGTYSVKDGKIVLADEAGETEEYAYTLEDSTLTLNFDGAEIAEGITLDTLIFKKA